ncbi:unnamed protein product [Cochlearia groenlandica]
MKLVVLISILLMLLLSASGFEEHGVAHTDQHSLIKDKENIVKIMDYEEPGPNPRHDPTKPGYGYPPPPPPPPQKN